MYSADADTENPENPEANSILADEDHSCKAIDQSTGELCGETESLSILHQFQKLYEDRIRRIDRELENECDRASMKLQIMREWIKNLGEQNIMLVKTVQDLECAACSRVKLLEEKLKQSSTVVFENMSKSNYTQEAINRLSSRVNELENDEAYMQQKIDYLTNDITGLLELIRRAKREKDWNLHGITFKEIQPSDIPSSVDCICEEGERNTEQVESLQLQVRQLQENERKMKEYQGGLEKQVDHLTKELYAKDETIKQYTTQFQSITNSVKKHVKMSDEVACSSVVTNNEEQDITSNLQANQRFKLMEDFKVFSIEAVAAVECVREEIGSIISVFNSQYKSCISLDEMTTNMRGILIKTREELAKTINKLELQEENRARHNNRVARGKLKLKDIKNEINLVQSRLSNSASDTTIDAPDIKAPDYSNICICNDLLNSVMEETEQITNNVQMFQTQLLHLTSNLCTLKNRLYKTDPDLKDVEEETRKMLLEHETVAITLREKETKFAKYEREISNARIKMENILDSLSSMDEECGLNESPLNSQVVNEILQIKRDLYNLQNENDDLKRKEKLDAECNGKMCQWKCKITDLQEQIRLLEHEGKIQQEANYSLRNTIQEMEEELKSAEEKMESLKRTHSLDSMELKKKMTELENTLRVQKETEHNLRQNLTENEVELKKSKELLSALHSDCGVEGMLVRCGCNQLKQETMSIFQLFKWLQNTIESTKAGIQDLENDLKKMMNETWRHESTPTRSAIIMMGKISKYTEDLDKSSLEINKLKEMLHSREKLIENMEEIIKIQKDSIAMTQAELKELHEKLQEKINAQDQIINQYKKEKSELLKQNELQIQTIGHLQNAVVEAKRCLDQMGHKAVSDLQKRAEIIRELTICVEETQSQYNNCFTEAAEQDQLLDLQRDSITYLQGKIRSMEQNRYLTIGLLENMYHSVFSTLQGQLEARVSDFQTLRSKINTLAQSKIYFENKYLHAKKSWEETERELQELKLATHEKEPKSYQDKMCQIKVEIQDKTCDTQDIAFDSDEKCLGRKLGDMEDMLRRLELNGQSKTECEKSSSNLENKQLEIEYSCDHITCNEGSISKYVEAIEKMRKRLDIGEKQNKANIMELDSAKDELCILRDRMASLKVLLKDKSDRMAKLEADYTVLKNDNSILKAENNILESKMKHDVSQLKQKLKETQIQLCAVENNYRQAAEDFHKAQEQLVKAVQRETDLQETLTITEKQYSLKLINTENEITKLTDLVEKLSNEIEKLQINNVTKNTELCNYQEACKCYAEKIENMQQDVENEREKRIQLEESNRCLVQQLQNCIEQNCSLTKEKTAVEENNYKIITELEEMHRSLLDLQKECHSKNKSLACISAELTNTAMSRSELCNESHYVVSCIRDWLEEQKKYTELIALKLKTKQEQLMQLGLDKRALLVAVKELKRINNLLTQKLKRTYKTSRGAKNVCARCYIVPPTVVQNMNAHTSPNSNYSCSPKKGSIGPIKTARRTTAYGNPWWFPKMEYLTTELRRNNTWYDENLHNELIVQNTLDESRDYGYQSSTSK